MMNMSYLSSHYHGIEPYYNTTDDVVTWYSFSGVLVAAKLASRVT